MYGTQQHAYICRSGMTLWSLLSTLFTGSEAKHKNKPPLIFEKKQYPLVPLKGKEELQATVCFVLLGWTIILRIEKGETTEAVCSFGSSKGGIRKKRKSSAIEVFRPRRATQRCHLRVFSSKSHFRTHCVLLVLSCSFCLRPFRGGHSPLVSCVSLPANSHSSVFLLSRSCNQSVLHLLVYRNNHHHQHNRIPNSTPA
jgi:hypothetical protein